MHPKATQDPSGPSSIESLSFQVENQYGGSLDFSLVVKKSPITTGKHWKF